METILGQIQSFVHESMDSVRRLRMNGSGIRRYGFTDKTSDVAQVNLNFAPGTFDNENLKRFIRHIELLRNLSSLLSQIQRIVNDELLIAGDESYSLALLYYNTLREQARQRVPGADEVFRILQPFFRRNSGILAEPTTHELERDLHALIHGAKDGKIVIEHETPHAQGGKHLVVDETYKNKARFREMESGEIREG
jgi:hypothetical protein